MIEKIVLGGGCFWCVEAVFSRVRGVTKVVSGYTGGVVDRPTYQQVCSGQTGHVEVCEISYENSQISLEQILDIFFEIHDPTTLNRQGHDVGTQYRSAIYLTSPVQDQIIRNYIFQLVQSGKFANPIVTEVSELEIFYPAEEYHQDYYNQNPNQGYCRLVIEPKLQKLMKGFEKFVE